MWTECVNTGENESEGEELRRHAPSVKTILSRARGVDVAARTYWISLPSALQWLKHFASGVKRLDVVVVCCHARRTWLGTLNLISGMRLCGGSSDLADHF